MAAAAAANGRSQSRISSCQRVAGGARALTCLLRVRPPALLAGFALELIVEILVRMARHADPAALNAITLYFLRVAMVVAVVVVVVIVIAPDHPIVQIVPKWRRRRQQRN